MSKLIKTITAFFISKTILVVFVAVLILALPQLNIQEYVLPTITSKTIYFLYGTMMLLGLHSLTIFFSKNIPFSFTKIDIALLILVFYISLNRYFIQSHYGFSLRYIELLGLSFFYIVLRTISLKSYPWLLLAVIVSGIIQAVYGNLQLLGYYPSNHSGFKMTGSFFNPGPYAGFLVSVWTIALGMYLFKDYVIAEVQSQKKCSSLFLNEVVKYTFEYIPLLGIISIVIVLPALQSRASWMAALVVGGLLLELKYHYLEIIRRKTISRFHKTSMIIFLAIIISTGLYGLYYFKKGSSDGRVFISKVTTEMIKDTPVFGVGFDRFKTYYMNYQANYFVRNGETSESQVGDNVYYAFNEGLQFVSENGFTGLVLVVIVIFALFLTKFNEKLLRMSFIAKGSLVTIGIFACFSYPFQILPIKLVLVLLLSLLSNSAEDIFHFNIRENKRSYVSYKSIYLLVAFVTMYQAFVYIKDLNQGFITWGSALNSHRYGDYKGAIQKFESGYPTFKKDGDFLMNYGKTLAMAGEYTKAISALEQAKIYQNNTVIETSLGDSYKATKQFNKAETCYIQAINMTPGKFYAPYLLTKLYDDYRHKEKAIGLAQKILKKKIKIPSTAIEEIRLEMKEIVKKYKNPLGFKN